MKLFKLAKSFRNDEDGAVTVDWVVLTAAIVGLGIAVLAAVETGMDSATTALTDGLTTNVTAETATTATGAGS